MRMGLKRMYRWGTCALMVAVTLALCPRSGYADPVVFELGTVFVDGGVYKPFPTSDPPWLRATFTDVTGGVQLYLEDLNLYDDPDPNSDTDEYVKEWYFNLADSVNKDDVVFTHQDGVAAASVALASAPNQFQADGYNSGLFEVNIMMENASADRFRSGSTSTYLITGGGVTASSFDLPTGDLDYYAAAHIGSLEGGESTWISATDGGGPPQVNVIPEPGTLLLLGSGLIGLAGVGRRRTRVG